MIRFQVAGRTVADIEAAIAKEMTEAGIPTTAPYRWTAEGQAVDVTTQQGRPQLIQGGYTADVEVKYP